ncbi:MAG: preprotein translocase subunit SecE [Oscillospiraceae bacterium]|nr:preprotein translocase subunit SecE [Oscillospiraceae bacterium]
MAENEKQEKQAKKTADKEKKPGVFARIARWFKELKAELKKVSWPSWKQTLNNTWVVIVCVVVVGIFIWVFDAVAGGVVSALISLVKG